MRKSVTSSNQTADRKAGAARKTTDTPENAGKGAAIAKSPAPASNVPDEKKTPPESPESFNVRITTAIPASLAEKIEEAARKRKGNRSAVLTECLAIGLSIMTADNTGSKSDRQKLRRAFHLLLAKRRSSIDGEEKMLFRDAETDKKRGTFTAESKAVYMAEYGRLTEENFILSMLEKGVSPDSVMRTAILADGETKPEWKSYLSLLDDLYLMFATPEEIEA